MGIVIETLHRSGQVRNREIIHQYSVSLGRAYNNDIIIDDPFVDAHHLQLTLNQTGLDAESLGAESGAELSKQPDNENTHSSFTITDQQSLNGTFSIVNNKRKKHSGDFTLGEGGIIVVGNTRLRIFTTESEISATQPLTRNEESADNLGSWKLLLLLLSAFSLVMIMDVYLSNPLLEDKTSEYFAIIYVFVGVIIIAGMAALVGKVLHGDSRIILYSNLLLLAFLVSWVVEWCLLFLFYSLDAPVIYDWVETLIYAFVVAGLLFFVLYWCSQLTIKTRRVIASIIPLLVLVNLSLPFFDNDKVNFLPPYDTTLLPRSFYLGKATNSVEFLESTQVLYQREPKE